MKKYEKYKEVGLPWLKEIPEGWRVTKGKYVYSITTGNLDVNNAAEDGLYPFFTCSYYPKKINYYDFDCEALLVAGNGIVGYTQYYNGKFNAYQRTYVLSDFKDVDPLYLKYYTQRLLPVYLENKYVGSVINFIVLNDIKMFDICVPTLTEQKQIVAFLDWKISEIDKWIDLEKAKQERLNELEEKTIEYYLFTGVNKNYSLKAIESSYMKEIPELWDLCKISQLFKIQKRIANQSGFDVLSITQSGIKVKDISKNEGQMASDYSKYQIVEVGDFAMNHMDLITGYIDISKHRGVTSPDYRVFTVNSDDIVPEYYLYMFQLFYKKRVFYKYGRGAANQGRWRLPAKEFLNLYVPLPSKIEQKEIVKKIEEKVNQIDSLRAKIEIQISYLEELKQTLISDAVTGKIDVRNIEIPDYTHGKEEA